MRWSPAASLRLRPSEVADLSPNTLAVNGTEKSSLKLIFNFGLSAARMAVSALSGLIVSIIIARFLGPARMGQYAFLVWVAGTIASVATLGLPDAVSKYVAERRASGEHALAAAIARRIVAAQAIVAGAVAVVATLCWSALDRARTVLVVLAMAAVIPAAMQQTLLAVMEGEQRFDVQMWVVLAGSIIQIGVVGIFALKNASVQGFLTAALLSSLAMTGLTLVICRPWLRREKGARVSFPREWTKRIWNFSLSVYGLWLLNLIVFDKSELFFLRIFKSPEEIAFYSIAFALTARLATAGDSISYVLFPKFVTQYTTEGMQGLRELYSQSMQWIQVLVAPVCLWGPFLLPRLVEAAYGGRYRGALPVAQILLVTLVFSVIMNVSSSAVYALERQSRFLRFMILVAVANIGLDFVLIPRFGAVGAAVANGTAQALAALGLIAYLRRLLPGSFPTRFAFKVYLAGLVSIVPLLWASRAGHGGAIRLSAGLAAAATLYGAVLVGTHAVTSRDFHMLGECFAARLFRRTA